MINDEPFIFVTRDFCLSNARSNIDLINRNYDEYLLNRQLLFLLNESSKGSEFTNKSVIFPACIPANEVCRDEYSSTGPRPVTLTYDNLTRPIPFPSAYQHVLWLSPVAALCLSSNSINIALYHVSQVVHCFICPLVIWTDKYLSGQSSNEWQGNYSVPLVCVDLSIVASSKIHDVLILKVFALDRLKCDMNVHADTVGYFVGCRVVFEFLT